MGCGNSKSAPVILGDSLPVQPSFEQTETTTSATDIRDEITPDSISERVNSPGGLSNNGTNSTSILGQPPSITNHHVDTPVWQRNIDRKEPISFLVEDEFLENDAKSIIKKHPPKKFQKLEEQQSSSMSPSELSKKQDSAQERRQKIISQRVQSAKVRTAKSAHIRSMAGANDDDNDVMSNSAIEVPDEL